VPEFPSVLLKLAPHVLFLIPNTAENCVRENQQMCAMNTATNDRSASVSVARATDVPGSDSATKPVYKALIVDDDPLMVGLLERYLKRGGYETISTTESTQALPLARKHLPSVILIDVMMPGMSGLAALRLFRQTEATKNTPVIVVSANDRWENREEAVASGAVAFLVKPFGFRELLDHVTRAMAKAGNSSGNGLSVH
jgi:CheY-like chemotaxis protein